MLCQSLSELCWFAARGHGASPSLGNAGYFWLLFSAFPDVSRAPCVLLAPLQLVAGRAVLLKPEWHRVVGQGTRGPGLVMELDLNAWDAFTAMEELQGWLHMQTRLCFSVPEECKGQRRVFGALDEAAVCSLCSEPVWI